MNWQELLGFGSIIDFEKEDDKMSDAISREEILSHAKTERGNGHEQPYDYVEVDVIKKIQPVKPEQKWIPCSERLPEKYTFVWATCKSLIDDRENWVIDACYVPLPKEYNSKYSDWGNIPMLNWGQAEVIAWMKQNKPEPYKAESEDKK